MERDWEILKAEFINGFTLKELSKKYNIPFSTVKKQHERGNWSEARRNVKEKRSEKLEEKLAEKQANKIISEAEQIQGIIDKLLIEADAVPANSKEGILRVVNDLYKVKGLYTGKTTKEQNEERGTHLKISAHDVYLALIKKDHSAIRKIGGNPELLKGEDTEIQK